MTYKDAEKQEHEKNKKMFNVEKNSFVYVRARQNYLQSASKAELFHVNMADQALHFWHFGIDSDSLKSGVNLRSVPPYPSYFSMNTNDTTLIPPRLAHAQTVFDVDNVRAFTGRA